MNKLMIVFALGFSPFLWAFEVEQTTFTFTSLVAGMLLISWFLAILQAGNAVNRVLDILLGIAALALLSTHSLVAVIVCGCILLAEAYFSLQKKSQRMALWLSLTSLILYLSLAGGYLSQQIDLPWLVVAVVVSLFVC